MKPIDPRPTLHCREMALREIRLCAGLSLRAAAALCGVRVNTYRNWENRIHTPPAAPQD